MDRRNSLPVLYTRGTYYEVGYDVGRTFRSIIEEFLQAIKETHQSLLKHFGEGCGKTCYDATVETLKENFPQYLRELQGTADGAGIPFKHLMVLHIMPRRIAGAVDLAGASEKGPELLPMGCTSVSLNREDEVLLGHTEDAMSELLNRLYIVDAHIEEKEPQGRWRVRSEKFTALCYVGHLPGFCMGYNHHGLVYSINVITPLYIHSGKTPRHFLCRALLAAENMTSVQQILKDEGVGAADGFSVNACFVEKCSKNIFQNLEVGPVEHSQEASQCSILTLKTGDYLLHTNRYLHLKVPQHHTVPYVSSGIRHSRAAEIPPPITREAIINLLSDDHHPEHPIFRNQDSFFLTTTLGLFDILQRTWTLWMANPKTTSPLFSLPVVFKWDQMAK